MDCIWYIQAPSYATGILLMLENFNLERCCDYLSVHEVNNKTGDKQIGRYTNVHNKIRVQSSSTTLKIKFHTDYSVTRKDFKLNYTTSK